MNKVQKWYGLTLSVLSLFLSVSLSAATSNSPKEEVVYKNWDKLGESSNHIDVFARVIKCTNTAQVHLMVFNESAIDQVSKFSIEITNTADNQKTTKEVSFSTTKATIYKADCNSDAAMESLKIDLPAGYDPSKVTITINFKS